MALGSSYVIFATVLRFSLFLAPVLIADTLAHPGGNCPAAVLSFLGPVLSYLSSVLDYLGPVLGLSWTVMGLLWACLGLSWACHELSWAYLAPS